jgi:hypothetical protein
MAGHEAAGICLSLVPIKQRIIRRNAVASMSCCLEIKLQSEQQNNMNIGAKWDELEPEDWHRLAAQWLQELRAQEPDKESGVQRTVVLMNFTASAEAQWTFILAAIAQARSDDELGHIAAGPLEHLLGWHGPQFIGRVEQQADQDPALKQSPLWRST